MLYERRASFCPVSTDSEVILIKAFVTTHLVQRGKRRFSTVLLYTLKFLFKHRLHKRAKVLLKIMVCPSSSLSFRSPCTNNNTQSNNSP